ncbi:hypothetical protein FHW36_104246 [Chitinophaga polysaccharea]|uniref:Uncharacterized protein n=1 Tax=Chitinophaga polysaccharea TaxID=1293035 RepID=A0A561PR31_9BACT|nr:hypothetical protein [Chitinophaga polysaccharea]TWF40564.1 hypothetical protein FHW36_104246 [Chitinophaga polysaccharea]
MKHYLIWIVLFSLLQAYTSPVAAQDSIPQRHYTRTGAWTTPVKRNTTINGIALSFMTIPWMKADTLEVNGLNLEIGPLAAFGAVYNVIGLVSSPFVRKNGATSRYGEMLGNFSVYPDADSGEVCLVRGLSLSAGGALACTRGISINGLTSMNSSVHGLEITGLVSIHYEFQGIMIAGLHNKSTYGRGLQVGLINACKAGKVVQIGLINKIGRRILPFVNCSFRKTSLPTGKEISSQISL